MQKQGKRFNNEKKMNSYAFHENLIKNQQKT